MTICQNSVPPTTTVKSPCTVSCKNYTKFIIIATCDIHSWQFRQHFLSNLWYLSSTSTVHFSPDLLERLRHNSFHSFGRPGLGSSDHTIGWQNTTGVADFQQCLFACYYVHRYEREIGWIQRYFPLPLCKCVDTCKKKQEAMWFSKLAPNQKPLKVGFWTIQPAKSTNFTNFISLLSIWTASQNPPQNLPSTDPLAQKSRPKAPTFAIFLGSDNIFQWTQ